MHLWNEKLHLYQAWKSHETNPILSDFCIEDTVGSVTNKLCQKSCFIRRDKQVFYRDFDPNKMYAPFVSHETIKMFFCKSMDQNIIIKAADVSNAYLLEKSLTNWKF